MLKLIAFLAAAVVGFLVAFSFTARDEIGAEVERKLDEDFIPQCIARAQFPPELEAKKPQICGCMKSEFDTRRLKLTDAFGDKKAEMQEVTQACARLYS
ncbi:hypothetical protein [Croceicoccus mobilis]|uniref:Uncharacterized protein n=1 Tax=Croceicoccus mobilis TaxID=1703339 RepID=A0A916YX85_9SPHN|nr:hypothetical protein [Croceicoccus mobilis]GGD66223.1 hypothetical protein GCM10010990_14650 [Croceicoccus mobilis]